MALQAGARLGSYAITSPIGAGAMGEVYRARDSRLGRDVAIKVLPESLAADGERLRRFEQEARAASALNHPNIVQIYDIGQEGELHYLVMELVDGVTLREALSEAPFGNERLLDLGRQLVAGLAKAHDAGIVHRDLKPENLMVTGDGYLKILDFGLAKLSEPLFEGHSELQTLARNATRQGMLIGTVEYMSPEQASAKPVDHRSDQFSAGLILYEMATGELAFQRDTAAQTLASIIESDVPSPLERNPACPPGLERVVSRCLQKDREHRYADTQELMRDMASIRVDEPRQAPPPPPPPPPIPRAPAPVVPPAVPGPVAGPAGGSVEVRARDGKIQSYTEERFRRRLRKSKYSGDELVRVGETGEWVPIYDTHIFRREVPYEGDPAIWVHKRKVMEFAQHAGAFFAMGAAWFAFRGEIPVWMAWWGFGLAMHGMGVAPSFFRYLEGRRKSLPAADEPPVIEATPAPVDELLPASFAEEVSRVKALLAERGGEGSDSLVAEVEQIAERARELARMDRDLEEQTSDEERTRLSGSIVDAERKAREAEGASDRKLYRRQLDVLRDRQQAIDKARAVVERLRTRMDVAEHQVKQLRLDLSRAAASEASVPQLTSRLQDIRHEIDAAERVDDAIAQELLS